MITNLYEQCTFVGENTVSQDCCQFVLASSSEQLAKHFSLNPAAGHWCLVITNLYEQCIFVGEIAVVQDCCQLVLASSSEQLAKHFALNSAAGHLCLVFKYLCEQWIFIDVNAVLQLLLSPSFHIGMSAAAQGCCQLVWHSSTEEQGMRFAINTAAVHWCLVTAHL